MAQNDHLSSAQQGNSPDDLNEALQKGGSDDLLSDDPMPGEGAQPPLSPEEYAKMKKEIEEEGDHNRSGHAND